MKGHEVLKVSTGVSWPLRLQDLKYGNKVKISMSLFQDFLLSKNQIYYGEFIPIIISRHQEVKILYFKKLSTSKLIFEILNENVNFFYFEEKRFCCFFCRISSEIAIYYYNSKFSITEALRKIKLEPIWKFVVLMQLTIFIRLLRGLYAFNALYSPKLKFL